MKKIMVFMVAFLFFFPYSSNISSNKTKNQNALQLANEFLSSDLKNILVLSAKQIGINAKERSYYG